MQANTFGKAFSITTFGESHGPAIGAVIDGCPPQLEVDFDLIERDMARRRPGQSHITTQRKEADQVDIISGVFEGKTTGHPITLLIKNRDQKSKDYSHLKDVYRPSHADYSYQKKYGIRDYRGGGRASARETASRVAAGSFAKMLLSKIGVSINAFTQQIGDIALGKEPRDFAIIENNAVRCPNAVLAAKMEEAIEKARKERDSLGGVIACLAKGMPTGLGEPIFDKLEADLAKACMSIPATKGFAIGSGFSAAAMRGSAHNDAFFTDENGQVKTKTNYSGGVQGGISTGEDLEISVAFKPVATIGQSQSTVTQQGEAVELAAKGRHDPCVVPRAVPIVEAMVALVLADHYLRAKAISPEGLA